MNTKKPKSQPSTSELSGFWVGSSEPSKIGSNQGNSATKSASLVEAQRLLAALAAKILRKEKGKKR
jgi:hypothetical protein